MTTRAIITRQQEIAAAITAIADACEKEERQRTEAEEKEYNALVREAQQLQMQMSVNAAPQGSDGVDFTARIRENIENNMLSTVRLTRSVQTTAALEDTGIIPVNQQEMLKPLREGLIWDKLGIPVKFGLVGALRWPKHGKAVATIADEAVALSDAAINFDALNAKPQRIGIAVPVTKEELFQSEGVVEGVIREEMPAAVADAINNAVLDPAPAYGAKIVGPFARLNSDGDAYGAVDIPFEAATPTRAELLSMKAKVAKTGIKFVNPCWVMTEDMKAKLEDVPVDAGSGRFICEGDRILGYPVYTTSVIGEGYIGFGDFSYQAAGFFGQTDIVVDPYTLARRHAVDFVLNMNFATATLYPEAFALGGYVTEEEVELPGPDA